MWEFTLGCKTSNKCMLDYINQCFCADIPECILTTLNDEIYSYLLFACDEKIAPICQDKIKQCIVTYIIDVYKYDYFMKTIVKFNSDNLTLKAYIKALTLYDVDTDIVMLKRSFELNNQFYLDSFLHFRLGEVVKMWKELCDLIMSNINYLSPDMMIDVMRNFISSFNTSCNTVKVIIDKKGFVLYRIDDDKQPIKLKDDAPAIDVINYILLSNPNKIEIYSKDGDGLAIINLLKSLYLEKVVLI